MTSWLRFGMNDLRLITTKTVDENLRAAVRRAQALVRLYIPEGRSLSEELIQERRGENPS
jgi:hypothetical protein